MANFYSHLSDEIDQDARTNTTHLHIIILFILHKGFIASSLTTMWVHTDGFTKHYYCEYDIYLPSYLAL